MKKYHVQDGTKVAPEQHKITVLAEGPYLVYGRAPLKQIFIMPDEFGKSWTYKEGKEFTSENEPIALCRCGASKNKPYCDGAHLKHDWDPTLTAPMESLLDGAEKIEGPNLTLTDNEKYCAFARFCVAKGEVWDLVKEDSESAGEDAIHEANYCPGGRLSVWDNKTGKPYEPEWPIMLGLVEDPVRNTSGGIFVVGGIPISKEGGTTYEVRNRVALCRCGQSKNKPFCDGTHDKIKFKDGLGDVPTGKEF